MKKHEEPGAWMGCRHVDRQWLGAAATDWVACAVEPSFKHVCCHTYACLSDGPCPVALCMLQSRHGAMSLPMANSLMRSGLTRIRCRATSDGAVGWATAANLAFCRFGCWHC